MSTLKLIPILLIALVVLCPFHCIFGGCVAIEKGMDVVAVTSCCGHCSPPSNDGDEQDSNAPTECPCGDCFCHGALPVSEVADMVAVEFVCGANDWVSLGFLQIESPSAQVIRYHATLPKAVSSLEVRAALCCWVI